MDVNLFELPSLPLSDRKSLPKKVSAIYFALSETNEVLYIGRAVCLYTRWCGQRHHKQAKLEELTGVKIAWLAVTDPALLPARESELINQFAPPLNLINNPVAFNPVSRKWAAQRKNVSLTEADLEDLEQVCKITRRTKSQVLRDALRCYAKDIKAGLVLI